MNVSVKMFNEWRKRVLMRKVIIMLSHDEPYLKIRNW